MEMFFEAFIIGSRPKSNYKTTFKLLIINILPLGVGVKTVDYLKGCIFGVDSLLEF